MGKLIKYEWKKQRTSRLVIMAALAVGILAFVWGLIFDKGNASAAGIVVVLMFSMAFLVLLYTGIERIVGFYTQLTLPVAPYLLITGGASVLQTTSQKSIVYDVCH